MFLWCGNENDNDEKAGGVVVCVYLDWLKQQQRGNSDSGYGVAYVMKMVGVVVGDRRNMPCMTFSLDLFLLLPYMVVCLVTYSYYCVNHCIVVCVVWPLCGVLWWTVVCLRVVTVFSHFA